MVPMRDLDIVGRPMNPGLVAARRFPKKSCALNPRNRQRGARGATHPALRFMKWPYAGPGVLLLPPYQKVWDY